MLAAICLNMADHASSLRNYDQAITHYKEALSHKPADVKALLSLTKLYMQVTFILLDTFDSLRYLPVFFYKMRF